MNQNATTDVTTTATATPAPAPSAKSKKSKSVKSAKSGKTSKTSKSSKTIKKGNSSKKSPVKKNNVPKSKANKPGRPRYNPQIPTGKWTFTDFEILNGINPDTGKGEKCTTLTLRKWLKKDLNRRNNSMVMRLKDVLANPNGDSGLGRKQFVYTRRPSTKKSTENNSVSVNIGTNSAPEVAEMPAPIDSPAQVDPIVQSAVTEQVQEQSIAA